MSFPINTLPSESSVDSVINNISVKDIATTPLYDWDKKSLALYNGSPKMLGKIEAIKQWILLFMRTPRGVYEIYGNYPFGTSVRELFGKKRLNNGYEESQLEREIREGLPLCPAIKRVANFNLKKEGRNLVVDVSVELYDGSLIEVSDIDVYTIR